MLTCCVHFKKVSLKQRNASAAWDVQAGAELTIIFALKINMQTRTSGHQMNTPTPTTNTLRLASASLLPNSPVVGNVPCSFIVQPAQHPAGQALLCRSSLENHSCASYPGVNNSSSAMTGRWVNRVVQTLKFPAQVHPGAALL